MDMLRRARRGMIAPVVHFLPKTVIGPELLAIIEKSTKIFQKPDIPPLTSWLKTFVDLRNEPVL